MSNLHNKEISNFIKFIFNKKTIVIVYYLPIKKRIVYIDLPSNINIPFKEGDIIANLISWIDSNEYYIIEHKRRSKPFE